MSITAPKRRNPIARLLFCDSLSFWGGGEHWIVQVGDALIQRGWEITVAGRLGSELLRRASSAGLPTVAWPYKHDFDLATSRAASRWMRDNKPDAILVTTGRDIRSVGFSAKRRQIPVVWRMGPKPKNNLVHRLTGALIKRVIAPSDTVRTELQSFSWLRDKITVISNGIPIAPVPTADQVQAARAMLGISNDTVLCLYVGRLMTGKGIVTLIDAFAQVRSQNPRAVLSIVGTGPHESIARDKVAAHKLDDAVTFTGYTSDTSPYFSACDIHVLPSQYESFSYVLLEAMMHAKACITTRAGAIPEVVGESAAILVPPGDTTALAQAIVELADDPLRRAELGAIGRQRVIDNFDLNKTVDEVESLFRNLINAA